MTIFRFSWYLHPKKFGSISHFSLKSSHFKMFKILKFFFSTIGKMNFINNLHAKALVNFSIREKSHQCQSMWFVWAAVYAASEKKVLNEKGQKMPFIAFSFNKNLKQCLQSLSCAQPTISYPNLFVLWIQFLRVLKFYLCVYIVWILRGKFFFLTFATFNSLPCGFRTWYVCVTHSKSQFFFLSVVCISLKF